MQLGRDPFHSDLVSWDQGLSFDIMRFTLASKMALGPTIKIDDHFSHKIPTADNEMHYSQSCCY